MHAQFPLFSSHIDVAHHYFAALLQPHDAAIDATCGNGRDTLKLAQLLGSGTLIGLDLQSVAIERTQGLLNANLSQEQLQRVHLYTQSHETFPLIAYELPIRLIVYNLGYLPNSDKTIKTASLTTLKSLEVAMQLIAPGGVISITCYPGHLEGKEEQAALLEVVKQLSPHLWNVCHHQWIHSNTAPSLLLIQRKNTTREIKI